jgi:hypothetical protein
VEFRKFSQSSTNCRQRCRGNTGHRFADNGSENGGPQTLFDALPICQRRHAQIDAFPPVSLALPVQRLMLAELLEQDVGPTISSAMVAAIGSGDELVSLPSKAGMDSQA